MSCFCGTLFAPVSTWRLAEVKRLREGLTPLREIRAIFGAVTVGYFPERLDQVSIERGLPWDNDPGRELRRKPVGIV
jgi:hypothetical protein